MLYYWLFSFNLEVTLNKRIAQMRTIRYIDRATGEKKLENVPGRKILYWLYHNPWGLASLEILIKRKMVSSLAGAFLNTPFSKPKIAKFVRRYNINLDEYEINNWREFKSFNDFFYRRIKKVSRPIGEGVISPADGKVLVFCNLDKVGHFFIKGSDFVIDNFLNDHDLANKYRKGCMVIIRLAPVDYHRFHFPYSGVPGETRLIRGNYYSVSPLALRKSLEIFCQNKRTISELQTRNIGDVLMSEVGATMVGSIKQTYKDFRPVAAGDEKGYFAFGGSTIVLLFEPNCLKLNQDLITNTQNGYETRIRMGETIGIPLQ